MTLQDEQIDVEPEAVDLTTSDGVHFERHGRTIFTVQVRIPPRTIGEAGTKWRDADIDEVSPTAAWAQLERFMRKKRLRVHVWRIDETGDYQLMQKPSRHRRQSPRAKAKHMLAVSSAERRYGEDRDGWPGHVQRQVERLANRR